MVSHLFYPVRLVRPPLFRQCLSVSGEDRVKTRSQWGYFWPSPMPGGEQGEARAQVPYHIGIVQ